MNPVEHRQHDIGQEVDRKPAQPHDFGRHIVERPQRFRLLGADEIIELDFPDRLRRELERADLGSGGENVTLGLDRILDPVDRQRQRGIGFQQHRKETVADSDPTHRQPVHVGEFAGLGVS
ncbi:hypothetical protein SDC9_165519 [bioreactor metagenome]|uniref:Uncharacterized protein n=1 Tax=bioreactor metagenome TaxID=1076179 RepID=A0A645FUI9_9ZZZZ